MSKIKLYDVYFDQINAQKITVQASSPEAGAKKAIREMEGMEPELRSVEWLDDKTEKVHYIEASELYL